MNKAGTKPLKVQKGPPKQCTRACWKFNPPEEPDFTTIAPYDDATIGSIEHEVLGLQLTYTPFDRIPDEDRASFRTAHELKSAEAGEHLIAAVVQSVRPHTDRKGNRMGFVELNVQNGQMSASVFSKQWTKLKGELEPGNLILGVVFKQQDGRYSLRVAQAV
jgi:DNA polymerase-3 subunit alpha